MCTLDGCNDDKNLPPISLSSRERRRFIAGLASLPLATVLSYPELAAAQAAKVERLKLEMPDGNSADGWIAMPETLPAPAVVLIHEWWGLNDQIKTMAAELAALGYIAYAIDLYDGQVADSPDGAMELMGKVDDAQARSSLVTAIDGLRSLEGANGKVGTVGWCFGGGWSINAALATEVDATVVYYGSLPQTAAEVAPIAGPVLGHFGTEDESIDEKMVGGFERAMAEADKADLLDVNWYVANHAFANPTGARYDQDDAELAWARTQTFFARYLMG